MGNTRFDSFYFFSTIFLGPGIGLNGFRSRFDYIKTRAGGVEREMFVEHIFPKFQKKIIQFSSSLLYSTSFSNLHFSTFWHPGTGDHIPPPPRARLYRAQVEKRLWG